MAEMVIDSIKINLKQKYYDSMEKELEDVVEDIKKGEAGVKDIHDVLDNYGVRFERGVW